MAKKLTIDVVDGSVVINGEIVLGRNGWEVSSIDELNVSINQPQSGFYSSNRVGDIEVGSQTYEDYEALAYVLASALNEEMGGEGEWGSITGDIEDQADLVDLIKSSGGNLLVGEGAPVDAPDNPTTVYINQENWDLYQWDVDTEEWDLKMGAGSTGTFGVVDEDPTGAPEGFEPLVVLNISTGVMWYYNGEEWGNRFHEPLAYHDDVYDLIPPTNRQIPDMGAVKGWAQPLLAGKVNNSGSKTITGSTSMNGSLSVTGTFTSTSAAQFYQLISFLGTNGVGISFENNKSVAFSSGKREISSKSGHITVSSAGSSGTEGAALDTTELTALRIFTFPDKDGVLATIDDIPTNYLPVPETFGNESILAKNQAGDIVAVPYSSSNMVDALVLRDSEGHISGDSPTENAHMATKGYVDARLSQAQREAIDLLVSPETDYADMEEATAAIKLIIDALKAE